jgi:hypothetical protein
VAWVELAQIGRDVGTFGNGEQQRARVIDGGLLVELSADRGGIQAAAACRSCILEDGEAQLEFGFGQRLDVGRGRAEFGQVEGRGL